jgi:hypothetical protein
MYTVVVTTEGSGDTEGSNNTGGSGEDDSSKTVGVLVGFVLRGGNDRENEGLGSDSGGGVAGVGSERAGGVLESYPSSPRSQIATLQFPYARAREKCYSRLITRPLARAARRRKETVALENMISKKVVKCKKDGKRQPGLKVRERKQGRVAQRLKKIRSTSTRPLIYRRPCSVRWLGVGRATQHPAS